MITEVVQFDWKTGPEEVVDRLSTAIKGIALPMIYRVETRDDQVLVIVSDTRLTMKQQRKVLREAGA